MNFVLKILMVFAILEISKMFGNTFWVGYISAYVIAISLILVDRYLEKKDEEASE